MKQIIDTYKPLETLISKLQVGLQLQRTSENWEERSLEINAMKQYFATITELIRIMLREGFVGK